MRLRFWKRKPKQTTFVYCPRCTRDLCSTEGVAFTDTDLVRYTCICGLKTAWDFDTYPVPVLVTDPKENREQ